MKRIFALLFVTTLVGQAWAYDFKYGDLYYNITGDNMVEVTYQYENSIFNYAGQTEIKIPEKVIYSEVEYVVTSIGDASFKKCNDLVSISIPNSITTIGSSAFEECGLTSVCIPNSVIRIERSAFMNCKSLISANIPNTVTHIGDWAFRYCTELKYMTIGNSVEYIGNDVFWECAKLDYNIYDNGCYLGNEENPYFILLNSKRNNISSCQINNRCHIIYNAFYNCLELTSIVIPDSVEIIGNGAFHNCQSLTSITIPNSVTSINSFAFAGCQSLSSIIIPNSVASISSYTFDNCYSLKHIIIPNSVKTIADYAFSNCINLKYITIGDSVESIGNETFYGCRNLNKILCKPQKPIELDEDIFPNCDTIYVLGEYVNSYLSASVWKRKEIKAAEYYNIEVESSNNASGTVTGTGNYLMFSEVVITATPAKHYNFVSWSDNNTDNSRTILALDNQKLIASFVGENCVISALAEKGIIKGLGTKHYGDSIILKAIPNTGYHFRMWGDSVTNNPRKIRVEQDSVFKAVFEAHIEIIDSAVVATCNESGLTEGKHCSFCGEVLVAQQTIPAKGHTIVKDTAVAATITTTGLTEGSHCSICGQIIVAQEVIPKKNDNSSENGNDNNTENNNCNQNNENQGGEAYNQSNENHGEEINNTGNQNENSGNTQPQTAFEQMINIILNPFKIVTDVDEDAVNEVNIYTDDNNIIVENATDEILVYNAMGALVGRDVALM